MSKVKMIGFALFFAVLLALTSNYVKAFTIAGPSMTPTYWYDDFVLSNHLAYDFRLPFSDQVLAKTAEPNRGDLIIYFDIPKNVIAAKRIVGLPGDIVSMENNILFINGKEVGQHAQSRTLFEHIADENDLGQLVLTEEIDGKAHLITYTPNRGKKIDVAPVKVTAGKYYILGDNRDNSADSRFIGLISRDQIKGKVILGNRNYQSYL